MGEKKYERWQTREGLLQLEGWARDGLSFSQIASKCGVSRSALLRWRKQSPEIDAALAKGRELVEIEIENALIRRALGYDYQETRVEVSEKAGRKVTETTRHAKPDVSAATFWLTHRSREKFGGQPEAPAESGGCILLPAAELPAPAGAEGAPPEEAEDVPP